MEPLQEQELILLAGEIPHTKFTLLCSVLGCSYSRGQTILASKHNDYNMAMQDILMYWKNKQTDPTQSRSVLESKLRYIHLGELGDKLSKGGYQSNQCSPRDKATASLRSSSVSVHYDEGLAGRKEDVSSRSNAKRLKRRRKEDVSSRSNAKRLKKRLNTEEDNTLIFTASESPEDICEGGNCEAITDVAYHVEANKKVCSNCASKEPRILKSKEDRCIRKARKGGPKFYCGNHDKDIDSYCKTHGVACCYSCAMIDHNKLCCERLDIEDAIKENRAILRGLKEKAKNKLKSCPDYGDQIRQCRQDTEKHLLALKDEVDFIIDEAMKTDKDREQEDAAKINQGIDEKNQIQELNDQIKKNNEEREKRLEQNQANSEKRRQTIENKQRSLHADIQNIAEETERKIGELEKSWQDDTKSTENAIQTLDAVLEDDQNVVKDGHRKITSVADELDKLMDEGGVKHITRTVSGVRLVKGSGREKYNGRIDGYDWEWKLIDTINVTDKITFPAIVGCIDESNVIIIDGLDVSSHTYMYMLDMNTKHTQRVITGSDTSWVDSCALLNDDKVVCGKARKGCTGDSLTGCIISVYDRQWKLINDVTISRYTTCDVTWVDVAVDQDGMIIAAEKGQSKIYVINPADGKIMNTITCKQDIVMRGVLSSGHTIAQPDSLDHRVFIIDREGAQREITHSDVIWNVCIDPMTDDLYVVTSDHEYMTCMIDQVMSGGDMKKRRVASFPISTRLQDLWGYLFTSRVIMTSSGNMIACDGDNILIFKKMFSL